MQSQDTTTTTKAPADWNVKGGSSAAARTQGHSASKSRPHAAASGALWASHQSALARPTQMARLGAQLPLVKSPPNPTQHARHAHTCSVAPLERGTRSPLSASSRPRSLGRRGPRTPRAPGAALAAPHAGLDHDGVAAGAHANPPAVDARQVLDALDVAAGVGRQVLPPAHLADVLLPPGQRLVLDLPSPAPKRNRKRGQKQRRGRTQELGRARRSAAHTARHCSSRTCTPSKVSRSAGTDLSTRPSLVRYPVPTCRRAHTPAHHQHAPRPVVSAQGKWEWGDFELHQKRREAGAALGPSGQRCGVALPRKRSCVRTHAP